jgi:hypothetical protein
MSEPTPEFFHHAQQVQEYLQLNLSEADTRVYLIDPVLRLLGYVRVGDLRREVPVPATKEFLDYELYADGKAQAIVEAKALRIPVTDQAAAQCVQYAAVLGVRWCIISNGVSWAIYNAHASGPLADKRVAHVRIDGDEMAISEAWEVLSLFSRDSLTQASPMSKLLAERVITDELVRPDSAAVQALRRAIRERFGERVAPQAIVDVIGKLIARPRASSAPIAEAAAGSTPIVESTTPAARAKPNVSVSVDVEAARTRARRTEVLKPDGTRVTFRDIVAAGVIPVDAPLEAEFNGVTHVARARREGVEFGGQLYSNLSAAASAARGGGAANGWASWMYQGKPVGELREIFLRRLTEDDSTVSG